MSTDLAKKDDKSKTKRFIEENNDGEDGKKKICFGLNKAAAPKISFVKKKAEKIEAPKLGKAASAFDSSEDDESEEMPAEAKMRMRNIGRETPTSSGPNSFGKSKMGFCDAKKIQERTLRDAVKGATKK